MNRRKLFSRLAEPVCGGISSHLGPGNAHGRWALTTRETGFYRRSGVHRAWEASSDAGCTGLRVRLSWSCIARGESQGSHRDPSDLPWSTMLPT